MKTRLTNTVIANLESRSKYYDVHDDKLPGMMVRVQPSGSKRFYVRYRLPDGTRRAYPFADARAVAVEEARIAARDLLADVAKGHDPLAAKHRPKDHTLRTLLPVYEAGSERPKAAKANVARIKRSFADLLDTPITMITDMRIKGWQRKQMDAGARPATINREITALRSALSFAVDHDLIEAHPLRKVKAVKVDSGGKPRFLHPEELQRLMEALDAREERRRADRDSYNKHRQDRNLSTLPDLRAMTFTDHLKPMIVIALNTGARRGEIFNLAWADVDLASATPSITIRGESSKSGKTRIVPLNATAREALAAWRVQEEGEGLVFKSPKTGGRFDNITTSWEALTKAANLPDFRFHDCRHHFASMLVQRGVDLNAVRELLGHSDLKLTMIYAHLAPENKARAVALLDAPNNIVSLADKIAAS